MRFHPAIDGLKFDPALQAFRGQSPVNAGSAHFGGDAVNIQWTVDQFDFVETRGARDSQRVLNSGRIVRSAIEEMIVIWVFGSDGDEVAAGLDFDPGFIETLFRARILDRVDLDQVLVPRGDVNCAIEVVEFDASSGGERIGLVELLRVPPYIRGMALSGEEQGAKASENGTSPRGEAMLAVHGSSVSTQLRRGKLEFVSV